jgi:translation initiation factor 1
MSSAGGSLYGAKMSNDKLPFNNPFAALGNLRPDLPAGPEPVTAATPAPSPAPAPARAVVRLERKGRGGKEVTVVQQLALTGVEAERWLRELKQALGCGGTIESDALVFQGDHRKRVAALLKTRGVGKVSVG